MIEVMAQQEWREKIPAGLPEGLAGGQQDRRRQRHQQRRRDRLHARGGTYGHGRLLEGLGQQAKGRADAAIAAIAAVLYEHLGEPA